MAFRYCPYCRSPRLLFEVGKCYRCPDCGFVYFHNVATAVGGIVETSRGLVLLKRALEPSAGHFGLPGGFVDPGEGVEAALVRECREEIGWEPENIEFLASFPNEYQYRGVLYNTCDLYFLVRAPDLREEDLVLDREESVGLSILEADSIDLATLAFDSTRKAIEAYRARRGA